MSNPRYDLVRSPDGVWRKSGSITDWDAGYLTIAEEAKVTRWIKAHGLEMDRRPKLPKRLKKMKGGDGQNDGHSE